MQKRVADHLHEHGLVPVMNATKWAELAAYLRCLVPYGPQVRLKELFEDEPGPGFIHLDWDWVIHDGETRLIEWLEIDPIRRTARGRLIPDHLEDLGPRIEDVLHRTAVPFSREGELFKVWGYVRAGAQPDFVPRVAPDPSGERPDLCSRT